MAQAQARAQAQAQAQALKRGHSKSKITLGSQGALSGALPSGVVGPVLTATIDSNAFKIKFEAE